MIRKNFFYLIFLLCSISFYGQGIEIIIPKPEKDSIYTMPAIQPKYKEGGTKGFYEYINKLYRVPTAFKGRSGTLIVRFVVDVDGQLTDIEVVKDLGFRTADEIIKVLKGSPKWEPGYNTDGKPIKVLYHLPVKINKD